VVEQRSTPSRKAECDSKDPKDKRQSDVTATCGVSDAENMPLLRREVASEASTLI
jgi:hypothetical protein